MTRSRQRGRRPQSNHNQHQNHNPNRTFDSSGPEVKIRGSASHVYEKYLQLARDANAQGDRVAAENYLQHAEHYYRILAAQAQQQQQYQQQRQQQQQQYNGNGNGRGSGGNGEGPQPDISGPSFSLAENGSEESDQAAAAE
ncbi:MAG: DUF4167 domain-containing protein [Alphaproteobacteria bacterium]|nr:DUF4167 domain-containing protein [Alphaproteobacteria bacterium]MBV9063017.1 DUF4167 domain-containing protein [Alphaproteobacteria bacterium]